MKENKQSQKQSQRLQPAKVKLVTVWWKDAFSHSEDVSSGDEVENSLICVSSGILLEKNEECVKIAMDLFDVQNGQESRSYRSIGIIPIEFIQRILLQEVELYDTLGLKSKASNINRKPRKKKELPVTPEPKPYDGKEDPIITI